MSLLEYQKKNNFNLKNPPGPSPHSKQKPFRNPGNVFTKKDIRNQYVKKLNSVVNQHFGLERIEPYSARSPTTDEYEAIADSILDFLQRLNTDNSKQSLLKERVLIQHPDEVYYDNLMEGESISYEIAKRVIDKN